MAATRSTVSARVMESPDAGELVSPGGCESLLWWVRVQVAASPSGSKPSPALGLSPPPSPGGESLLTIPRQLVLAAASSCCCKCPWQPVPPAASPGSQAAETAIHKLLALWRCSQSAEFQRYTSNSSPPANLSGEGKLLLVTKRKIWLSSTVASPNASES